MPKLLLIEASIKDANLWSVYVGKDGIVYSPKTTRQAQQMIRNIKLHANVDVLEFRATSYVSEEEGDRQLNTLRAAKLDKFYSPSIVQELTKVQEQDNTETNRRVDAGKKVHDDDCGNQ